MEVQNGNAQESSGKKSSEKVKLFPFKITYHPFLSQLVKYTGCGISVSYVIE